MGREKGELASSLTPSRFREGVGGAYVFCLN